MHVNSKTTPENILKEKMFVSRLSPVCFWTFEYRHEVITTQYQIQSKIIENSTLIKIELSLD